MTTFEPGVLYWAPAGTGPDDPSAWTPLGATEGFTAQPDEWSLAICLRCLPMLPQPFRDPAARDVWASAHTEGTGHRVVRGRQVNHPDGTTLELELDP